MYNLGHTFKTWEESKFVEHCWLEWIFQTFITSKKSYSFSIPPSKGVCENFTTQLLVFTTIQFPMTAKIRMRIEPTMILFFYWNELHIYIYYLLNEIVSTIDGKRLPFSWADLIPLCYKTSISTLHRTMEVETKFVSIKCVKRWHQKQLSATFTEDLVFQEVTMAKEQMNFSLSIEFGAELINYFQILWLLLKYMICFDAIITLYLVYHLHIF